MEKQLEQAKKKAFQEGESAKQREIQKVLGL